MIRSTKIRKKLLQKKLRFKKIKLRENKQFLRKNEIFPRKRIYQVWKERLAIQGEYMLMLNVMIAMYYFGIKEPENYLAKVERRHINKLLKNS